MFFIFRFSRLCWTKNWLSQGYVLILGVSMALNGVHDGLGPGSGCGNEDSYYLD
jgi:hypothetical protein